MRKLLFSHLLTLFAVSCLGLGCMDSGTIDTVEPEPDTAVPDPDTIAGEDETPDS